MYSDDVELQPRNPLFGLNDSLIGTFLNSIRPVYLPFN